MWTFPACDAKHNPAVAITSQLADFNSRKRRNNLSVVKTSLTKGVAER